MFTRRGRAPRMLLHAGLINELFLLRNDPAWRNAAVCARNPMGKTRYRARLFRAAETCVQKKKGKKKLALVRSPNFPVWLIRIQNWDWLTYGDYRVYEFTKKKIFGKLVNFLINLLKFFFFWCSRRNLF